MRAKFKCHIALVKCMAGNATQNIDLAKHCLVTAKTVSAWRQPRGAKPSIDKVLLICGYYGLEVSSFAVMGES